MRVAVPVRARPIAMLLVGAIALVACGEPPPPDLSGSRPVTFESRDGVVLEGRLFGDGSTGVVLSHMQPADQRSWFAFANRLSDLAGLTFISVIGNDGVGSSILPDGTTFHDLAARTLGSTSPWAAEATLD